MLAGFYQKDIARHPGRCRRRSRSYRGPGMAARTGTSSPGLPKNIKPFSRLYTIHLSIQLKRWPKSVSASL